jgi:hypothetical protein
MSKAIDQDITATFEKLKLLLQYSTANRSDEVLQIVSRASTIWNEDDESYLEEDELLD